MFEKARGVGIRDSGVPRALTVFYIFGRNARWGRETTHLVDKPIITKEMESRW